MFGYISQSTHLLTLIKSCASSLGPSVNCPTDVAPSPLHVILFYRSLLVWTHVPSNIIVATNFLPSSTLLFIYEELFSHVTDFYYKQYYYQMREINMK